jgi:hypothetical protein
VKDIACGWLNSFQKLTTATDPLARLLTRPLHPAGNPAKNDPFFENTAR